MTTAVTRRLSFSDNGEMHLTAPSSWEELQRGEIGFILKMIVAGKDNTELKVLMLLRFTGIHIEKEVDGMFRCYAYGKSGSSRRHFYLMPWQVESLSHAFDWVDRFEDYSVRLDSICGNQPVDHSLHGLPFGHYLKAESYYQGFLRTKNYELLGYLGQILYRKKDGTMDGNMVMQPWEQLHCFLWFGRVKQEMAMHFPNFYKPCRNSGSEDVSDVDVMAVMNIQIRALTDGDITKEALVLQMDCWRALTELDAKARDAADIKRKTK